MPRRALFISGQIAQSDIDTNALHVVRFPEREGKTIYISRVELTLQYSRLFDWTLGGDLLWAFSIAKGDTTLRGVEAFLEEKSCIFNYEWVFMSSGAA